MELTFEIPSVSKKCKGLDWIIYAVKLSDNNCKTARNIIQKLSLYLLLNSTQYDG
jgi:hypothetical protein